MNSELLNSKNQINETEQLIKQWIERGEKIIYPQNFEDWTNCVKNRANDGYHGADLECALKVMESLDNDEDLNDLEDFLNRSNYSGQAYYLILKIILSFSKHGPDFMEHITHGDISADLQQAIQSQREENLKYEAASTLTEEVNSETNNELTDDSNFESEFEPMDINVSLQVIKKKSIFSKIISFIKGLFKPKHKLLESKGE